MYAPLKQPNHFFNEFKDNLDPLFLFLADNGTGPSEPVFRSSEVIAPILALLRMPIRPPLRSGKDFCEWALDNRSVADILLISPVYEPVSIKLRA